MEEVEGSRITTVPNSPFCNIYSSFILLFYCEFSELDSFETFSLKTLPIPYLLLQLTLYNLLNLKPKKNEIVVFNKIIITHIYKIFAILGKF